MNRPNKIFLKAKRNNGFTLIEVIVAITIFAVSVLAILNLFSTTLKSNTQIRHYTIGLILAQSKMAEIKSGLEIESAGIFEEDDIEYEWSVHTNPTEIKNIEEIRLQVTWKGQKAKKNIELVGYRVIESRKDREEK
ncbi:MAG: prepilin-type N-terminal cleavage/methylation domain-containing protein [bacterium]